MDLKFSAGDTIAGRYLVERQLGAGASGVVYLCSDLLLSGLTVVLKMFGARVIGEPVAQARIQRELLALARINHPRVVRMYDTVRHGEIFGYSMEFHAEANLRDMLNTRGRLDAHEALAVLLQICDGLSVLHQAGLVHRDLKPENIIVAPGPVVKLVDLGLVRAVDLDSNLREAAQEEQALFADRQVTAIGDIVGTPIYFAPEYISRGDYDERSDVYCAALIAYELLSGEAPFGGIPLHEMFVRRVTQDSPPLAAAVPQLPAGVGAPIMQALARDPARRFPDARSFSQAVQEAADAAKKTLGSGAAERASRAARHGFSRRRRALWSALVLIGIGGLFWLSAAALPLRTRFFPLLRLTPRHQQGYDPAKYRSVGGAPKTALPHRDEKNAH